MDWLRESGAVAALIDLKLSQNTQFRDEAGGCKLAEDAAKFGDDVAARRQPECITTTQLIRSK